MVPYGQKFLCGTPEVSFSRFLAIYGDTRMKSCFCWSVAKPNNFSRLWALVCSPPLKRQGEHCERLRVAARILLMILPASVYSYCPLGDLKFPVGVPALARMQTWTESLLPRCNREVALSLLLYRSRGELQV